MRSWLRGQGHGRTSPQDAQSDKWKCSHAKLSLTKILRARCSLTCQVTKGAHKFKQETDFMGQAFESMSEKHKSFLQAHPCFFVATVSADGRGNSSPKGFDSLRVISPTTVIWLNITGSGNETAAHIRELPKMTLWPAFQTC